MSLCGDGGFAVRKRKSIGTIGFGTQRTAIAEILYAFLSKCLKKQECNL